MSVEFYPSVYRAAQQTALRSEDDSTKVGCIITAKSGFSLGVGYNQFPKGCERTPERCERPAKYAWTVHAEMAAIASMVGQKWYINKTAHLYSTQIPCSGCMGVLSMLPIDTIFCPNPATLAEKWKLDADISLEIAKAAGIDVIFIGPEHLTTPASLFPLQIPRP